MMLTEFVKFNRYYNTNSIHKNVFSNCSIYGVALLQEKCGHTKIFLFEHYLMSGRDINNIIKKHDGSHF